MSNSKQRRRRLRAQAAELNKLQQPDILPLDVIESAAVNLKRLGAIPITAIGSGDVIQPLPEDCRPTDETIRAIRYIYGEPGRRPPLISPEVAAMLMDDEQYEKAVEAVKE